MFSPGNMMSACNPLHGRYLTVASVYRGKVSMKEVEDQTLQYQTKMSRYVISYQTPFAKENFTYDENAEVKQIRLNSIPSFTLHIAFAEF